MPAWESLTTVPCPPSLDVSNHVCFNSEAWPGGHPPTDIADSQRRNETFFDELGQQRNYKKRTLFDALDEIEQRKDALIGDVEARLPQRTSRQDIFTVRWRVR
jgi:hypothetical protein